MFRIEDYIVESNNLSESLCEGYAKRIYKGIEAHQEKFITHHQIIPGTNLSEFFVSEINALFNAFQSKRKAILHIHSVFVQLFQTDFADEEMRKSGVVSMDTRSGLGIYQALVNGRKENRICAKTFILNSKKPQQSIFHEFPILFTEHAIARILQRFKPNCVFKTLINLSMYLSILNESFIDLDENEFWLPIKDIGTFRLKRDESRPDLVHVITFVDEKQLSQEQLGNAEIFQQKITAFDEESSASIAMISQELIEGKNNDTIKFSKLTYQE